MITQKELKEILNYDPETGVFTWKEWSIGRKRSLNTGCISKNGYIFIGIKKKIYYAHRLAWLYVYGEFPFLQIDHINGNKLDNRICNLRCATRSENLQNLRSCKKTNLSSKLLGVSLFKRDGTYQAEITINRKKYKLGRFNTAQEAHDVYLNAKRKLHPYGTI